MADLANLYDWQLFEDVELKRLFGKITDIGTSVQDDTEKLAEVRCVFFMFQDKGADQGILVT